MMSSDRSRARISCGLPWQISRAEGCLLGHVCGDALGSEVEFFSSADKIRQAFPTGVREMFGGGTYNTLKGQPTDESELAIALARILVQSTVYNAQRVRQVYLEWFESCPFDCNNTTAAALCGNINDASQNNGALVRMSPLGLFGAGRSHELVADWARQDAALTHPNPVCQEVNAIFVLAISRSVQQGLNPQDLYESICHHAVDMQVSSEVLDAVHAAQKKSWIDQCDGKQEWVLVAWENALWQLLHAPNMEEAVVDTIHRGGSTAANAAICGSLLGAVYGREAIPKHWSDAVLRCEPQAGEAGVGQPRPAQYWPSDLLELARELVAG